MDDDAAREVGARLAALYAEVHCGPMRDAPICNDALNVEAIGFRAFEDRAVGVIVTPWFMNVIAAGSENFTAGARQHLALPAGDVEFVESEMQGFGRILSCSLFSPMFDFADMTAARDVAREAMAALFNPALLDEGARKTASEMDRRALLRGAFAAREEALP